MSLTTESQFSQAFTSLRIIFIALLVAQLTFAGIVFYLTRSAALGPAIQDSPLLDYVLPLLIVVQVTVAVLFASRRMDALRSEPDLATRIGLYKTAFLLKCAMLEGASFLALIGFLLSQSLLFVGMFIIVLLTFLLNKPNAERITEVLSIGREAVS